MICFQTLEHSQCASIRKTKTPLKSRGHLSVLDPKLVLRQQTEVGILPLLDISLIERENPRGRIRGHCKVHGYCRLHIVQLRKRPRR